MRQLRRVQGILLIAALVITGSWQPPKVSHAAQSMIKQVAASADTLGSYEKLDLRVDVDATFKNPYDPDDIKLDGIFTSPSGKKLTVPGFYYDDFTLEYVKTDGVPTGQKLTDTQKYSWKVRFTPEEVGNWTYTVEVTAGGKTEQSDAQHFTVNKSDGHGFLRQSKRDFRYLEFSDGTPFFGIGLNMGWYGEGRMADYQRWIPAFSAAGGNLIRVWLAPWGFSPEWNDTPLGDYGKRQDRAYELDKLFELAEQNGIYIQLTLLNHGQFSETTNPQWNENPYNAANGGPLKSPAEFATNPQAVKLWKQRLRYIAARWGYSTHLMAWEWWNEVGFTPLANPDLLVPWIKDSAAYLSTLDPYNHLITHSNSPLDQTGVWGDPTMSITGTHIYSASDWAFILADTAHKWINQYQKPYLLAEYGYADGAPDLDPTGVRLHIGLWVEIASGALGTGQFWWWDTYIEAKKLYQPYKAVAAFVAGEDFAAHHFKVATAKASKQSMADVYGLQGDDGYALLWIVSGKYTDTYFIRLYQNNLVAKAADPFKVTFPDVKGLTLNINGLPDGQYSLTWWDPQEGKVLNTVSGTSAGGKLTVDIPTFQMDLALKVKKAGS